MQTSNTKILCNKPIKYILNYLLRYDKRILRSMSSLITNNKN